MNVPAVASQTSQDHLSAVLTLPDDQNASPWLGAVRNGPSAGIPETHL